MHLLERGLNLLKKAKGNPEEAYKLAIQEIEKKYSIITNTMYYYI